MSSSTENRFDVDVRGRVRNLVLEKKHSLLPVYEAVINSIQSCLANGGSEIKVFLERDHSQPLLDDEKGQYPIRDIRIIDNGIGFDASNYKSFLTSDTTNKLSLGGKGIGRFLWLKAFEKVQIESVYRNGEDFRKRSFAFRFDENPIQNHSDEITHLRLTETSVTLMNIVKDYQDQYPKSIGVFAQKILEHCLSYFILGPMPKVTIEDEDDLVNLNAIFESDIRPNIRSSAIDIRGKLFSLSLIRFYTTAEKNHRLFYCAHNREVKVEKIEDYVPLLFKRLEDDKGEFIYLAYVSGTYFDDMVNQERTAFNIPQDNDGERELGFGEVVRFDEVRTKVVEVIESDASTYLEEIRTLHRKRIDDYATTTAPEYRHLIRFRPTEIDKIPAGLSETKLELELHRISQLVEREIKEKSIELLEAQPKAEEELEKYVIDYSKMMDAIGDLGMSNLAKYVGHRRMVLQLLEDRLGKQGDGKYALEEAVHKLVFPLKTSSDDSEYGKQNLWIIDERLSYHAYLASDKSFNSIELTGSGSSDRPDIIVFNRAFAFVEEDMPYSSIVVIEFKRPVRDDYDDDNNPIVQVQTYIKELRENRVKDKDGRFITVSESTPFYGYIVCDITPKLRDQITMFSFFPSPDGLGYYWFNQQLRSYIEIISYDKLLQDAKKRNHILFEKLGLPPTLKR